MKLTFVAPRYGAEIVGGAERLVRDYCLRAAASGDDVEVLTTCARSIFTWANELTAGETNDAGVRVLRFPVTVASDRHLMARLQPLIDSGIALPDELADDWIRNTGLSEPLLDAVVSAADRSDAILFAPYWVANTVLGAALQPAKSLVIPCLHDEPYARFGAVKAMLSAVSGLIFNSQPEAALAQRLLGSTLRHRVVGAGFDPVEPPRPADARRALGIDGTTVAYAGRQEPPKRFPMLVEWVVAYNDLLRDGDAPLTLLTMGTRAWDIPPHAAPSLRDLGFVDEETKLGALSASLAAANLSRNESFSYLVMESWMARRPVIVHADAEVTRSHCEASGGGLWVSGPEEFAEAVTRLRHDPVLADRLGNAGRSYVEAQYSWPAVLDRLHAAVTALVS